MKLFALRRPSEEITQLVASLPAVSRSDFSVQVPPGHYFLIAKGGEGIDAVQADVAAGHVYYVRLVPRMGVWLAGVELAPIKPGEQDWPRLSSWLERTNHLTPWFRRYPSRSRMRPFRVGPREPGARCQPRNKQHARKSGARRSLAAAEE